MDFWKLLFICILFPIEIWAKVYNVYSPDKNIKLSVEINDTITWQVEYKSQPLISPSLVMMKLKDMSYWGKNAIVEKAMIYEVKDSIITSLYKKSKILDYYNILSLNFKGSYGLQFRVYNDGIAYRWLSNISHENIVLDEIAEFNFVDFNSRAYVGYVNAKKEDVYSCSFENTYKYLPLNDMSTFWPAFAPILIEQEGGVKCAISEADLESYPGMFFRKNVQGKNGLIADFAPYPVKEVKGGHNDLQLIVTQRADYIAKVQGKRTFPWRTVIITDEDKQLLNNDMIYKLASPCRIQDISWITPGKLAWDYWNAWNVYGVDFRAGINTDTYLYYIDFAAENHLEYVLLDEGWADSSDIMKVIPEIDLPYIIRYASIKGVKIILWAGWLPLKEKMDEALDFYSKLGIKGFKVDFMDRDDQKVVDFCYLLAAKAAQHKLIIDYHGVYKPTGIQRTYPNVINFEGVYGLEYLKGDNPDMPQNDVLIPYIRMLAGPVDYTPGAMVNANKDSYRGIHSIPMSQGTRAHQVALYVVFEAPLNMLADSPTNYIREVETTNFIKQIPTVFEQTVALDGKVGEFAAIARKQGDNWYIGALTNWTPRTIEINFSFLDDGIWQVELFKDGVNADRNANDYKREIINVDSKDKVKIYLAPGGGVAGIIRRVK